MAKGSTDELVSHRSVRRVRTPIHAQLDKNEEIIIYYVSSTWTGRQISRNRSLPLEKRELEIQVKMNSMVQGGTGI